ncbi:Choline transport protein [Pseudocercospora fuligena]|uniref:Choline transport protein n=1 Tax=Pseudocercospora fuligena TaxID=685502 RepID=A0A8H6RFC7_9PEZI|nr:Choline transport protein [Pseudocercospora fuligena]
MADNEKQPPNVFNGDAQEELALEKLGYQQELKRSFGLIGMIGFSFSIVTCWSALSGVLIIGVESGGPPVMIWSWLGICTASLAVAYSMAEMCSAYPVAGGQYSWVAALAPRKMARAFSYVCVWFMLIGILAMGATNNFIRWHTVLVTYAVGTFSACFNIFGPSLLEKASRGLLIWNICAFLIIVITILAVNDHKQSAAFVFKDFVNETGFNRPYCAIVGLLQSAFGMCCYDAPAHMCEEIHNARKQAPRAIILSVYVGAITGFIFLIAAYYCMGSIDDTAMSSTGVPIIEIFYNSTSSRAGASCLTVLLIVIGIGASNALTAEGGRAVYAFARDRGLPFSDLWSKVEPKKQIPIAALCLTVLVQVALDSIYFGTVTGFNTVVSIATQGFYVSYAMPLMARLASLILPSSRAQAKKIEGGLYSLGAFSVPLNIIGLVFLLFTTITFNFPSVYPVTSENMNYTSAAVGIIMAVALLTWVTTGQKQFTGPEPNEVLEGRRASQVVVSEESLHENMMRTKADQS